MPILALLLLGGVLTYMYWRRKTTTLTRNCRWREDRRTGDWACAYCGMRAQTSKHCLAPKS